MALDVVLLLAALLVKAVPELETVTPEEATAGAEAGAAVIATATSASIPVHGSSSTSRTKGHERAEGIVSPLLLWRQAAQVIAALGPYRRLGQVGGSGRKDRVESSNSSSKNISGSSTTGIRTEGIRERGNGGSAEDTNTAVVVPLTSAQAALRNAAADATAALLASSRSRTPSLLSLSMASADDFTQYVPSKDVDFQEVADKAAAVAIEVI